MKPLIVGPRTKCLTPPALTVPFSRRMLLYVMNRDPDAIDRVVRNYVVAELGLDRSCSAHSMRATFITTALENGAWFEDVQKAASHHDSDTTKLYDRVGTTRQGSEFFAIY